MKSERTSCILVLDDDPDIGVMIRLLLEYNGYSVIVTERAEKALAVLHEAPVNLVIMDMYLSGVNGTDICRQLKAGPQTARLPIVMISAHPHARQLCLEAGADDFLAKPFDMQELLGKISALLEKVQA